MGQEKRRMSFSRFISLITSAPIAAMGLIILLAVFVQVTATVEAIESDQIQQDVAFMKSSIVGFLEVRRTALETVATQPIVVQSVLHPNDNNDNMKDYLDSLMILKKDYNMSLYDFKGELLYKEESKASRNYGPETWMQDLLSGGKPSHLGTIEDGENWWLIAVPVIYSGSVEGVLVAEIPIADIFDGSEITSIPAGMKLELFSGGDKVIGVGDDISGISHSEVIDEMGLQIVFTLDNSATTNAINTLIVSLILAIGVFTAMTIIMVVYFGKHFVAQPVNEVRAMAMQLADGDRQSVTMSKSMIMEIQALHKQFIIMADRIDDRESALIKTNDLLEDKNSALEKAMEDLENAQGQMIQQEKLASIGHLAAGVAHELNNPIGFVSSNFSVLKDYFDELNTFFGSEKVSEIPDNVQFVIDDVPELISDSQEGLNRVTSIVRNLLSFSREDIDERSDYDLNQGIRSTLIVARNQYKYVAEVETDLGDLPHIYAKGSEINDVLLNLIVNASHAISSLENRRQGLIQVRSYADEIYVTVEVEDNGPGIKDHVIGKIFDPFFTTKGLGKGTGLGLNIAYNTVVDKHKGVLRVESNYGEGAKFTMKLPIGNREIN